jgi:hypothetical protein
MWNLQTISAVRDAFAEIALQEREGRENKRVTEVTLD